MYDHPPPKKIIRRRENMFGVNMVLAENHQMQTWPYKSICYLLFEGVMMVLC